MYPRLPLVTILRNLTWLGIKSHFDQYVSARTSSLIRYALVNHTPPHFNLFVLARSLSVHRGSEDYCFLATVYPIDTHRHVKIHHYC